MVVVDESKSVVLDETGSVELDDAILVVAAFVTPADNVVFDAPTPLLIDVVSKIILMLFILKSMKQRLFLFVKLKEILS